jgi:RHS repeat-associated protein
MGSLCCTRNPPPLVAVFCLILTSLIAYNPDDHLGDPYAPENKSLLTDLNAEPSCIVAGRINVISGDFVDFETDLTVPGPEPFTYSRCYSSINTAKGMQHGAWHSNHQGKVLMKTHKGKHHYEIKAKLCGLFGERNYFEDENWPVEERKIYLYPDGKMFEKGVTNAFKGSISAQTDPKQTQFYYNRDDNADCKIIYGSNETQVYTDFGHHEYLISEVIKPSGMHFYYNYDGNKRIKKCQLFLPSGVNCGHIDISPGNPMIVTAPDGRFAKYYFNTLRTDKFPMITKVERSDGPTVKYQFEKGDYSSNSEGHILGHRERIIRKDMPDDRFLEIEYYNIGHNWVWNFDFKIKDKHCYYLNRVKHLKCPVGPDKTPIITHYFHYDVNSDPNITNHTGVFDVSGNYTCYNFGKDDRLTQVIKYSDGGKTAYTQEDLKWSDIRLMTRSFGLYGDPHKTFTREFAYDNQGNILVDALYGNITGNGYDGKTKVCTYSRELTSVQEDGILKEFEYVPGTNLLSACFYSNDEGIFLRYFYTYDANCMVMWSACDDGNTKDRDEYSGVTMRKTERTHRTGAYPFGVPLIVAYDYINLATKTSIRLKEEHSSHDKQGRLIKKVTYDANGTHIYTQEYAYDDYGNLLQEKNSLGHTITREYDENGNKTREEGPFPGCHKEFGYDYANRLIKLEEHHLDGVFIQYFSYDLHSRMTQSIDAFGQATNYEYDAFGRRVKEKGPEVLVCGIQYHRPTTSFSYDELSNPIEITDPQGAKTRTSYTIYGKPYHIIYPDGSEERFEYNLRSELVSEIGKNGTKIVYTRDHQGRVTKKQIYSKEGELLSTTSATYNTFHLLSETDPDDNIITYTYDAAGRKIGITQGDRITHLEYDGIGRVIRTRQDDSILAVKYDALDRIVEEWQEDTHGMILKVTRYEYDELNRKVLIEQGDPKESRVTQNTYDTHGILVKTIDPEEHVTTTTCDWRHMDKRGHQVLKTTTTDPKGIQTLTVHDVNGKPVEKTTKSPFGHNLHHMVIYYDIKGNRKEIIETPYADGKAQNRHNILFCYDSLNRIIEFTQAGKSSKEIKVTTHYNLAGQKQTVVKPDGRSIHYTYDALGRLHEISSGDKAIHYRYNYDANSNPIRVENLINSSQTVRKYDIHNRMRCETLQNGLTTQIAYSPHGKITRLAFPDQSSAEYGYHGDLLIQIDRISKQGDHLYSHTFDTYDTLGQIKEESLMQGLGVIEKSYTPRGNLQQTNSPFFLETMHDHAYDAAGNLLDRTIQDPLGNFDETFAYDELNHLSKEEGVFSHNYTNDSLHNRMSMDGKTWTLNSLNQILSDEENTYSYDLSGNLKLVASPKGTQIFTYDALDRLTKVMTDQYTLEYVYDDLNRCLVRKAGDEQDLRFFYLNQYEIGACNDRGEQIEFQLLGPGRKTEPCRAVAIELNNIPYAPIHDQSGHIRCLIDQAGVAKAVYRYSAYGETFAKTSLKNPYQFAGKRQDPLTGLILFGRRFYSPGLGRFITQDPAGYDASPNPYAYLAGCPLSHYDAFGLFEFSDVSYGITKSAFPMLGSFSALHSLCPELMQTGGNALHWLGRNVVPFPLIKEVPMAAGYFFANQTFKGYTPSYREQHSKIVFFGTEKRENVFHFFANGMNNTWDDGVNLRAQACDVYNNERGIHVFLPSHGFAQDLCEFSLQRLGVRTNQVKKYEKGLRMSIEEAGGPGEGHYVTVDAHSRGGQTTSSVQSALNPNEKSMLWINTYGSAKLMKQDGYAHLLNNVSIGDLVPAGGDPFAYRNALFLGDPNVRFLPAQQPGFEHAVGGDTYRGAMNRNADEFYKKLGSR